MRRSSLAVMLVLLFGVSAAYAQEGRLGAGRFEAAALPGGGMFFTTSDNQAEPEFGNYMVGGAFAYNVNRWFGIEAEGGGLIGLKQDLVYDGRAWTNQRTPLMFGYTGNLVVNPWGSDHPVVPFVTGGVGGLTLVDTDEVAALGVTSTTTFMTGNFGGGLRWFASNGWGVRGEYRLTLIDGKDAAPAFFGRDSIRYGHRVSAGLVFTY